GLIDRPNVFSASFSYRLPFGDGHRLSSGNSFVNGVIGGWEVSGLGTFSSGPPLSITSTSCNLPQIGGSCLPNYNPNFTGPVTINGGLGSGQGNLIATSGATPTTFIDRNAFVAPAAYTFGSAPRTLPYGLRAP